MFSIVIGDKFVEGFRSVSWGYTWVRLARVEHVTNGGTHLTMRPVPKHK